MGFSKNLCSLMKKNKVSSYKLATEIGVHVSTVTNWREGKGVKIEHLKMVADYFGVTIDELISSPNRKKGKNGKETDAYQ